MKALNPYLTFDGNAREAMLFYADAFRAELHITNASEMPNCPTADANKVLHARLEGGPLLLMASDNLSTNPFHPGNNVSLSLDCSTAEEQTRLLRRCRRAARFPCPCRTPFGRHTSAC